jgi:hypothetical protein
LATKTATKRNDLNRELPGAILGVILLAILAGISWFLGEISIIALGWGGIVMGLLIAGFMGYLYAALNRKRRYDYVLAIMVFGYLLGAFIITPFFPDGQFLVNLATAASGAAFIIWILLALFVFALLLAPFVYAKRTDLR